MRYNGRMTKSFLTACLLACPLLVTAQEPAGFRGDFVKDLDAVEKKYVGLAQAVPQEKYGWRPAEKVRSISEVYMHLVGANYMIAAAVGVKPPAGLSRDMEKTVTEKAKVVEMLKASFAHLRKAAVEQQDAELDKAIKLFGRESTVRGAYFLMATHMHEHLGQSIAYARTNGVTPPWSGGE